MKIINSKEINHLFIFLKPFIKYEILLLLLILISSSLSMVSPIVLKIILDELIPTGNYSKLLIILLLLVVVYLIRAFVSYYSEYLGVDIGNKIVKNIKLKLFGNLIEMPFSYFETNKPGDIIQKVYHEVDKIQYFLTTSIIRFLNNLFTLIGLIVMISWLDFKLFLVSVSVIPFSLIISKFTNKKIRQLIQKIGTEEGNIYNFYYDRIRNIKLIKLFAAHEIEKENLKAHQNNLLKLYLLNTSVSSLSRSAITFIVSLSPLIVFAYGGYQVIIKALTVGSLVAFIQYLNRIYAPSNDLLGLYTEYARVQESAKRILPILSFKVSNDAVKTENEIEKINNITINNLNFSYNNRTPILRNINIKLVKGRKYVIVGANGSGKTTLLKILTKLYPTTENTILLNDDFDLEYVSPKMWVQKITIIYQDSSILYDSIQNNIKYGKLAATEKEINECLQLVSLGDFIETLPNKLNTVIGDGENSIIPSGGQAQSIALARLFLKPADIVVLDEATSSLDTEREVELMLKVMNIFCDSIIISISHRLNHILNFDEVFFLENGKIVERGSPKELLDKQYKFYALFKDQIV